MGSPVRSDEFVPVGAGCAGNREDEAAAAESVVDMFEKAARNTPDAVAVTDGEREASYAELDTVSNRLAHLIGEHGITPETVVGVCLPRGIDFVTALLAMMKTGAAYVPLDPARPGERLTSMLRLAGARLVLTRGEQREMLSGAGREVIDPHEADLSRRFDAFPRMRVAPSNLAYVMFTSGSTGQPKPVAVPRGALARHAVAIRKAFGLTSDDRVLQFAGPAFDVAAEEIFPTLSSGARIVVAPDRILPTVLERFLRDEGVTVANLPSSYWAEWVHDLDSAPRPVPDTLRLVVVGSESTRNDTLRRWYRHSNVRVLNAYGLTETTITATLHDCTGQHIPEEGTVPIGTPIEGVDAHLLDSALAPVPEGSVGELYLGGALLARGYHEQPQLTADRFIPDPFSERPGARLYRTGDLAFRSHDGTLHFAGRIDDQVNIRGHRVEPAEVSAALMALPEVSQAHVMPVEDGPAGTRLVAYLVPAAWAPDLDGGSLRARLERSLPAAWVPTSFVVRDALPVDGNGNIDSTALPSPEPSSGPFTGSAPTPRGAPADHHSDLDDLEGAVAAVWQQVLQADEVGREQNFFDIGGHSLLLVQVQRWLSRELGREIPTVALFTHPTVRSLARYLAGAAEEDGRETTGDTQVSQRHEASARMRRRRGGQPSRQAPESVEAGSTEERR